MTLFKKKDIMVDVIDFSAQHVSTGQIGEYILNLYEKEGFNHMGYRFENVDGNVRFFIYTLPGSTRIIQYFKDRCPAMIEEECRKLEGSAHYFEDYPNGFSEVKRSKIVKGE